MAAMIGRNHVPSSDVPRPMKPISRRLVVLVTAVLLAACNQAVSPSPSPSASSPAAASPSAATPSGPLVTIETRGGECPEGACGSTVVIERDGRVHALEPAEIDVGTVPPAILEGLNVEIDQADFEALAGVPFTGECPVNVDGQEIIYTFTTASGEQRLASCEVVVDPEHPLFVAISAALAAAGA